MGYSYASHVSCADWRPDRCLCYQRVSGYSSGTSLLNVIYDAGVNNSVGKDARPVKLEHLPAHVKA